jgi:hypothetical protein
LRPLNPAEIVMAKQNKESAAEREKRLAQALRANLKRRKAQARDKAQAGEGEGPEPPVEQGQQEQD